MHRIGSLSLASAMVVVLTCVTAATGGVFPVDPGSMVNVQGTVGLDLAGTLIGDWDETDNPAGTRTLPGLWGGSGNQPIDFEMGVSMPLDFNGDVTGAFRLDIEPNAGVCVVQDVAWDLLSGGDASAEVTLTVLYETFRSLSPDSLYPGGVPIELPVGESVINAATFNQTGPGIGTAEPVPDDPGAWSVAIGVPGLLHMELDQFDGQLPLDLPTVLLFEGTYTQTATGETVHLTASFSIDETTDLPNEPLPAIPFELPTIIPPGNFAGVLLNLAPQSAAIALDLLASIDGHNDANAVPGDVNSDGVVNADDLLAVLAVWGPCDGCPEDLNQDGYVGVDEILTIIEHWG